MTDFNHGDLVAVRHKNDPEADTTIALVRRRHSAGDALEFAYLNGGYDLVSPDLPATRLVVINPEDPDDIERFSAALANQRLAQNPDRHNVRAAFRSLVAPPKPPEPTGFAAVVEDMAGELWVRVDEDSQPWRGRDQAVWSDWSDVAAVRVVSPGVDQ